MYCSEATTTTSKSIYKARRQDICRIKQNKVFQLVTPQKYIFTFYIKISILHLLSVTFYILVLNVLIIPEVEPSSTECFPSVHLDWGELTNT